VRKFATWSVRHRRTVVLLWAIALVFFFLLARVVGTNYSNSFSLPHTPSVDAINLLKAATPQLSGDTEQVVFASSKGATLDDPAIKQRVETMLGQLSGVPHVSKVVSPYDPGRTGQINASDTVGFATVTFNQQAISISNKASEHFVSVAQSADTSNLQVAVAGQVGEDADKQSFGGTGLGVILAAVVLLLVFGSLFAMALPLISALASLGTAISVIGLLSNILGMPQFSPELVLLIGLGVGVDYALFIVTRHRQGLMAGQDPEASIVNAVNTSGRAILFAGIVVCIALLGMCALGISFFYGLSIAAALGVLLTMFSALTLIPALLGFIGPKVLSPRQKRSLATDGPRVVGGEGARTFWARWADFVQRRPIIPAVVALVLIILVALPFFSIRLGESDQGNDPVGTTTRTAYDLLAKGFGPGFNGPLQIVAKVKGPAEQAALTRVVAEVKAQPGVAGVTPPLLIPTSGGSDVALVNAFATTSPQAAATTNLVNHLRAVTIPRAVARSGLVVYVGGTTAVFIDFANVISSKLPLFFGLVILLSLLLLAVVFRSVVIPLTAAVMNLLSVGAAFGIITAVFQWGWLGSIFGVSRTGPVESFLPVMLFAILFGLSMDYQVFLVTRIHEEWIRTGGVNAKSIRNGLAATGKTITAAALIMILVFASFILGGERVIKEFGIGLAGGVLVDAVLIRMAVVPSLMMMFGKANWWLPGWLDRILPHVSVDADDLQANELPGSGPEPEPELAGSLRP
jgi:putative drug exporter of the RND superfamily